MDNTDNNDIEITNITYNSSFIINDTDNNINSDSDSNMNDTDTILKIIRNSTSGMNNKYESSNSEINNFFKNIIINQIQNQNKNKSCRSANISIIKESYLRVTNNVDNYCCTIQTESGWSNWFYFNSSIDGIGFIVNANESWSWQKKSDFELI
jgi:hypothetical protein